MTFVLNRVHRALAASRAIRIMIAALVVLVALLGASVGQAIAQDDAKDQKDSNKDSNEGEPKVNCDVAPKTKKQQKAYDDAGCEPPPPQVSLANLASPAPAATDTALAEALEEVGFEDTWYSLTTTHPRLALISVAGTIADQTRATLLEELNDLGDARTAIERLLEAIEDTRSELKEVDESIGETTTELAELGVSRSATATNLSWLQSEHARVVKGLQDTAIGVFVAEEQAGAAGIDDVGQYNDQQILAERVGATIEELLFVKATREADISTSTARLDRLDAQINAEENALARLEQRADTLRGTIDRLTNEVTALTQRRVALETGLPATMALAQQARLEATEPTIGVSLVAIDAYVQAVENITEVKPNCVIRWEILAGIAKIESGHGTFGGGYLRANGDVSSRILGPLLDGSLEGTAVIADTDGGRLDGNAEFDAAVGPFQFIPGTWKSFALDATGDGFADPHNMYDGALSAAGYLCTSSSLADDAGIARSVLSYNQSQKYLADVTGVARDYIVRLALPEAAFDPETLEVEDGWALRPEEVNYEEIGQLGPVDPATAAATPGQARAEPVQTTEGDSGLE